MAIPWGAIATTAAAGGQIGAGIYESRVARKWAQKMRRSAYQATVSDMRDAGINPILVTRTGPTPTPGVPASAQLPNLSMAVSDGINSSVNMARSGPEIARTKAGTKVAGAQVDAIKAQTKESEARAVASMASARETEARAQIQEAGIPAAIARGEFDASPAGQWLNALSRGFGLLGAGTVGAGVGRWLFGRRAPARENRSSAKDVQRPGLTPWEERQLNDFRNRPGGKRSRITGETYGGEATWRTR